MPRLAASLTALLVLAVIAVSGYVGHQLNSHPRVQNVITRAALEVDKEGVRYLSWLGFSCGVESWDVKVMRDAKASEVSLTPRKVNIPILLAEQGQAGSRTVPPESFQLSGTHLIAYKLEPDSDIHLVLRSTLGAHPTMIAEIPNPGCAAGSRVLAQITQARSDFVQQIGTPQTYFKYIDQTVALTGIGFYDFQHGQTGVAPNGIELHPVISFRKIG